MTAERQPRFSARLLASVGSTNLADGILVSAFPLILVGSSRADSDVAFGIAVLWAPTVVALVVGGAILDRFGVRVTTSYVQLGRAGLIGLLAIDAVSGGPTLWLVAVVGGLVLAGEFLFDSAIEILVARSASTEELPKLFGRMRSAELVGNRLAGPALGGVLVAVSPQIALLMATALFATSLAFVVASASGPPPGAQGWSLRSALGAMRRSLSGPLRTLAALTATAGFGVGLTAGMMVILIVQELGFSEAAYGVHLTSMAVGGIVAGLVAGSLIKVHRPVQSIVPFFAVGLGYLIIVTSGLFPVIYSGGLLFGASMTVFAAFTATIRQVVAPDDERGTVATTFRAVGTAAVPVGAVAAAPLASIFGPRSAFLVAFAAHAVVATLTLTRGSLRPERFGDRLSP